MGAGRRHISARIRYVARRITAAENSSASGRLPRGREQLDTPLTQQNELLKQHVEELRRQNTRFDMALNNMSQGLCMFDGDHRLVVCNARYLEMYGLTPAQTQPGTGFLQLLRHRLAQGSFPSGATPEEYTRELYASLRRTSAWNKVTRLDDGRFIAVSNRVMPDGGWIATHDDVTEREELHAQLQEQHELAIQQEEQLRTRNLQFDLAVNNMSQGLCFFDGAQRLVVCNNRYLQMYGLEPEQNSSRNNST